jgi:hypothetical protein
MEAMLEDAAVLSVETLASVRRDSVIEAERRAAKESDFEDLSHGGNGQIEIDPRSFEALSYGLRFQVSPGIPVPSTKISDFAASAAPRSGAWRK